jgi:hypothetical protein
MKEEKSNISKELKRLEVQIEKIYKAIESVDLLDIEDVDDRLRAAVAMQNALKGLPTILGSLEELRNKNKVSNNDIKGSAPLSPLDDGTLDDE